MSRSLLRIIEVKIDGKWQPLDFASKRNNEVYDNSIDDYINSPQRFGEFYQHYITEVSLNIRDKVFGEYSSLKRKRIPEDICDELKNIVNSEAVCVDLEDWPEFIRAEKEKYFNKLSEYFYKYNFDIINQKLDYIVDQTKLKRFNKKFDQPDNEDLEEDKKYIFSELWYYIIDINVEYDSIYNMLYDIYNDWPECRIYYWIE